MNNLHAYWRIKYIQDKKFSKKYVFSEIPNMKDERSALLLYRSSYSYIVINRYPYNAGHLLVIPYREVSTLKKLSFKERSDFFETIVKGQDILEKSIHPDGFNIGFNFGAAAGAGIPNHMHGHIVPRWNGDTNFMPILTNTKVLPEALDSLWLHLRKYI